VIVTENLLMMRENFKTTATYNDSQLFAPNEGALPDKPERRPQFNP
jgi:hypothetical protein